GPETQGSPRVTSSLFHAVAPLAQCASTESTTNLTVHATLAAVQHRLEKINLFDEQYDASCVAAANVWGSRLQQKTRTSATSGKIAVKVIDTSGSRRSRKSSSSSVASKKPSQPPKPLPYPFDRLLSGSADEDHGSQSCGSQPCATAIGSTSTSVSKSQSPSATTRTTSTNMSTLG
ncbi:unnamed protein product, partial [Amoebophrya sp. A25]